MAAPGLLVVGLFSPRFRTIPSLFSYVAKPAVISTVTEYQGDSADRLLERQSKLTWPCM